MLLLLRLLALCLSALPALTVAQAGERAEIERLFRSGDATQAMQRLERAIASQPQDAQLRFLKGVLLAESGQSNEAAEVYMRLTQEFPDLPEPHNNLAVLYAAQGDLDKARIALETALRNDPSYATAHENLGDVYVRLAMQAYARANGSEPAQHKLELARQLFGRLQAAPSQPQRGS